MSRPVVSLVITELDDTLYDWLSALVPPFYAMVAAASLLLEVSEEQLLGDLQQVHRKRGDLEHPMALLETRAVQWRLGALARRDLERHLAPAFQAFRQARQQHLGLRPGAREGLEGLSQRRVRVIGLTESRASETMLRLNRLGIKSLMTAVYVPERGAGRSESLPATNGFLRQLPRGFRKPNPRVLGEICARLETAPADALYVGNSGADLEMARRAGVQAAWARYAAFLDPELWSKLTRVAHWTEAEAEKVRSGREAVPAQSPACVLARFDELLDRYDFRPSYTRGEWWGLAAPGNSL